MKARGAFWVSKKRQEDSIQFVGGILWLFLFALLVFSSSSPYHKTQNSTRELNNFYFIFWLNVRLFSARLWVHEKVLQTSFQLLHVSEETRVFARRNMWMVANGTRRNWKFTWTITAHTTPGHWRTRTLALTWIPAFFIFLYFTFLVLFACFSSSTSPKIKFILILEKLCTLKLFIDLDFIFALCWFHHVGNENLSKKYQLCCSSIPAANVQPDYMCEWRRGTEGKKKSRFSLDGLAAEHSQTSQVCTYNFFSSLGEYHR